MMHHCNDEIELQEGFDMYRRNEIWQRAGRGIAEGVAEEAGRWLCLSEHTMVYCRYVSQERPIRPLPFFAL